MYGKAYLDHLDAEAARAKIRAAIAEALAGISDPATKFMVEREFQPSNVYGLEQQRQRATSDLAAYQANLGLGNAGAASAASFFGR